jgi:hypothetical protein
MSDTPRTAFNPDAPNDERLDAQAALTQSAMPTSASDLLPREDLAPVIDYIQNQYAEQSLLQKAQVLPFPGRAEKPKGMQSVYLDGLRVFAKGDYFERPNPIGYESLRQMVEQTPILNAVIMTRIRQVLRFANVQDDEGPGFVIRHIDRDHEATKEERDSQRLLSRFMANCGWELNPRRRKMLKRDNFSQFLAKLVRESLTYDAAPIETELKRDKRGIDGFYALDGSTIRLCTDEGYRGDDAIFAVQVVQGRVVTAYTHADLIYEPRNPRADVRLAGYGLGETELLIRVVTGFLNAMAYNQKGFDDNSIPKGILHLTGEYSSEDLAAFRRYWNAMARGVNNAWTLPVLTSRDAESKASFERLGIDFNEMYFSKWMTFLTSIICAVYGMSPAEINFDSFTAGNTSALSGADTAEKLAASRDSGLRPLMAHLESTLSDFIIADFSDKYVFRWVGMDEEDQGQKFELRKAVLTVNEIRAQEGYLPLDGPLGDAPVNPSLVMPWMQMQQQPEGGADGQGEPEEGAEGEGEPDEGMDSGEAMEKANPNHGERGRFARNPDIRYEKRQLSELYDYTLKHPLAAPDAMLVTLKAKNLSVQIDKGPAIEAANGQIKVVGRKKPGRGYGMVKILWKHGQKSGKPDGNRVTRGDVLAIPEIVRSTPTAIVEDSHGNPRAWEWRRRRFDGETVVYAASRFSDTDSRNHIVTIHVDNQSPIKKAAVYAAGDLFGRTPQLPDDRLSVALPSVEPLTCYYCPNAAEVNTDTLAKTLNGAVFIIDP